MCTALDVWDIQAFSWNYVWYSDTYGRKASEKLTFGKCMGFIPLGFEDENTTLYSKQSH